MRSKMIARGSVPVLERPARGAPLVTEVVVGERVEVAGARPGWLEVVVSSHASRLDRRGFPGWIRAPAVGEGEAWDPDFKGVKENLAGLPLGALPERPERKSVG